MKRDGILQICRLSLYKKREMTKKNESKKKKEGTKIIEGEKPMRHLAIKKGLHTHCILFLKKGRNKSFYYFLFSPEALLLASFITFSNHDLLLHIQ
jgi:hypothetical protein